MRRAPKPEQFAAVASVILTADPPMSAREIKQAAKVRTYIAFRVLDAMLGYGWIIDEWENVPAPGRRPPRRFYRAVDHFALRELAGRVLP